MARNGLATSSAGYGKRSTRGMSRAAWGEAMVNGRLGSSALMLGRKFPLVRDCTWVVAPAGLSDARCSERQDVLLASELIERLCVVHELPECWLSEEGRRRWASLGAALLYCAPPPEPKWMLLNPPMFALI